MSVGDMVFTAALGAICACMILVPEITRINKALDTQKEINAVVIESFNNQADSDRVLLDYLKTISKKPGQ